MATAGRLANVVKRLGAMLAALALATGVAACGGDDEPVGVTLTISRDFGTLPLVELQAPEPRAHTTVIGLLRAHARVQTGPGRRVVSIDGLGTVASGVRAAAWFVYVNGVRVATDALGTVLHDGDHVWWDRHAPQAATAVHNVVGAFPEPFLHGVDGKRLPVRVECGDGFDDACRKVSDRLVALGVPAARGILRGPRMQDTLRVLVGTWSQLRGDEALGQLERGPGRSGVYVRPAADGRSFVALDPTGRPTGSYGTGTGLVAATRFGDEQPVWAVTGTDRAGVGAAAQAFDATTLGHRFAVLVSDSLPISLPVDGASAR